VVGPLPGSLVGGIPAYGYQIAPDPTGAAGGICHLPPGGAVILGKDQGCLIGFERTDQGIPFIRAGAAVGVGFHSRFRLRAFLFGRFWNLRRIGWRGFFDGWRRIIYIYGDLGSGCRSAGVGLN